MKTNTEKLNRERYDRFMSKNATDYGSPIIVIAADHSPPREQIINFYEHPTMGDEAPVYCVCHEERLCCSSDFYETDDMIREDTDEYRPTFRDGVLYIGDSPVD